MNIILFFKNDFGNAITCLKFLNKRIYCKDSNLLSCGGNGWLRFWEISNGKLVAEFQAHTHGLQIFYYYVIVFKKELN